MCVVMVICVVEVLMCVMVMAMRGAVMVCGDGDLCGVMMVICVGWCGVDDVCSVAGVVMCGCVW